MLATLAQAGCRVVYLNGSFVTAKEHPRDYDACWGLTGVDVDALDPVLLDFDDDRAAQRAKYGSELFPAQLPAGRSGQRYEATEYASASLTRSRRLLTRLK